MAISTTEAALARGEHARLVNDRELEVLYTLENMVAEMTATHEQKRELWFPCEILQPADTAAEWESLRRRAAGVPDGVRVALALNLLTEEGLPHFHRVIATCL